MSDVTQAYVNGHLSEQWDDNTRVYSWFNPDGSPAGTRAYTAAENSVADARNAAAAVRANIDTLTARASSALAANTAFLALGTPTNAQILAQTQLLTRECSALIRLMLRILDSTS